MKKGLFIVIIITVFILSFSFFSKKNVDELKSGKYVEMENGLAWVILKENNEFQFNRHITTSYDPIGSYSVEDGKLVLKVSNNEEYKFNIDGEKLVFENGTYIGDLIKEGAVFQLSNRDK
ncbi:hypothetical protein [Wukongibacter sp. M2B1]|uniref:hypothetical protein n=1 Tax=Wukongibacter sp. M2B1 TaxID=3088895 RepID=UPI003D7B5571